MITYNWKAEFNEWQKGRIAKYHRIFTLNDMDTEEIEDSNVSDANLIAEMANALDRYEAILNEMEGDRNYCEEDGWEYEQRHHGFGDSEDKE